MAMNGVLLLEDGVFFRGFRFGAAASQGGEVVFNTSHTGYQEILTDPSYAGQIVTLTCPHIGNYGVNGADIESSRVRAGGLIVRDHHPVPSNWRSNDSLAAWMKTTAIPGLCGVDTRALVLHIRERGALRGWIADTSEQCLYFAAAGAIDLPEGDAAAPSPAWAKRFHSPELSALLGRARAVPSMAGQDLASQVSCTAPWTAGPADAPWHVVAVDYGIKRNIVRQLVDLGCRVTVMPAASAAVEVLALQPDGVLLSNGPGDPGSVVGAVATIRALLGRVPIFGICLGHQLLAIACGGRTFKLPFGHRGSNHPVRDLTTGRVEITAQNHGFAVDTGSLDGRVLSLTHLHLNDDTVAGLSHRQLPAFSVQFHPEASPGPHDSHHLFGRFVDAMARHRQGRGHVNGGLS